MHPKGSSFCTGPIRTLADLEGITSAWVHWYNTSRLMHRLGRRPRQKPKPSTTLTTTTASRLPLTHNEARRKWVRQPALALCYWR